MLAIGGVGHGGICSNKGVHKRKGFRSGDPFNGKIDDVFVWSHSLTLNDVELLSKKPVSFILRTKLSYKLGQALCVGQGPGRKVALKKCSQSPW